MRTRTSLIILGSAALVAIIGALVLREVASSGDARIRLSPADGAVGYEIAPNILISGLGGGAGLFIRGEGFLPAHEGAITRIASLDGVTVVEHRTAGAYRWLCVRADGTMTPFASVAAAAQHCGAGEPALQAALVASDQWLASHRANAPDRRR